MLLFFSGMLLNLSGQVSEARSGVKQLNISKRNTEIKKLSDETRSPADAEPPVIKIEAPEFPLDSIVRVSSKVLTVRGKVEDNRGIFEVVVNGIEAKVASDGTFLAEVPQAFGKNHIKILATDVSMNSSFVEFYTDRLTSEVNTYEPVVPVIPIKPSNTYSIELSDPGAESYITASDKFNIKACIKATAPLRKVMISRNGTFVNGYLSGKIVQSGDCAFSVDEPVNLKLGINEIKIEVFAADDTVSKNITVEYSLYAARNFAVIIGNNKYDDPLINELDEPLKDAQDFFNTITGDYNFEPENVKFLKNATKAEIIGTLHELRSKVTPTDNLLIFYAGHGFWDQGMGVGYWLPRDAAKNNPVNWLPNTDLTNYLGAIKTKHTLLIADACFSGGIFKTRAAFSATYAIEMLYQLNSRKAITSGYLSEVPDKSVFFQYLIKNLKENQNDYLSAEELFSKFRLAVINNSENVPQFGTIQNVGDEGGDFIFIRRKR